MQLEISARHMSGSVSESSLDVRWKSRLCYHFGKGRAKCVDVPQGHPVEHLTFRPAADGSLHVHASPSSEAPGNTHSVSARRVEPQPVMWVCSRSHVYHAFLSHSVLQ